MAIFSERLFYSSVIKKIYQLENFEKEHKKDTSTHHSSSNNLNKSSNNASMNQTINGPSSGQKVDRLSSMQP